MAHFAEIDDNNIVLRVVVIGNNDIIDENGNEKESIGIDFCKKTFNGGNWVQTSYNNNFRKNYAGLGYKFDSVRDAFIAPKPFPSWTLNEQTCRWEAPVPYPNDGQAYSWDEKTQSWNLIPAPSSP